MQIQQSLAAQSLVVPTLKPTSADTSAPESKNLGADLNATSKASVSEKGFESAVDSKVLAQSVNKLNSMVQGIANGLQFSVDEESKTPIVKLVDLDTKEVIRQIPTEEAISIAQAIDRFQGLLVKDKA